MEMSAIYHESLGRRHGSGWKRGQTKCSCRRVIDEAVTDSAPTLDLWYTVIDANELSIRWRSMSASMPYVLRPRMFSLPQTKILHQSILPGMAISRNKAHSQTRFEIWPPNFSPKKELEMISECREPPPPSSRLQKQKAAFLSPHWTVRQILRPNS
ncbi:hypothetical protein BDZ45DRAFT_130881 [Acephala macrosclerotiorum]|nr:hypothetical protein BDZ45DRAFT_130881 [Acephala macrosclerotiorum]